MKKILPFIILSIPLAVSAQLRDTGQLISRAGELVINATKIVAAIALLVFFWGLVKFIMKAGDEKAVAEGRRLMLWGIVALFVMVSVWGLVYFIGDEIFPTVNNYSAPSIPTFPR